MLRWITAGESHGPELIATLEGMPAGVPITVEQIQADLERRKLGAGRGARMKFEKDALTLSAGIVRGTTIGSPIAIRVGNTEWPKWMEVMSAAPPESEPTGARAAKLTRPRPGHADLTGMQKYGFNEARPVLERASARETAARVALGAIARSFLSQLGIELVSHTVAMGAAAVASDASLPKPSDVDALDADPVRSFDAEGSAAMLAEVEAAKRDGDTLGGVVEVLAYGMPPGVGSYVHWDRRLDARLAGALMSVQAIKGVEVGDGFETATRRGSEAHDEILAGDEGIERASNRAGGIEGGMTNGQVLRVRAAMKPISTVPRSLRTVDVATGEAATAHHQRSDITAVPAAGVVAEAMTALILADAMLEKFGGDSVAETRRNMDAYLANIHESLVTQNVGA